MSAELLACPHFIDGDFCEGHGEPWMVYDPSIGDPIGKVVAATAADVADAVAAARDALPGWAGFSPEQRGEMLRTLAARMRACFIPLHT